MDGLRDDRMIDGWMAELRRDGWGEGGGGGVRGEREM